MGGQMRYVTVDNRDFLRALVRRLISLNNFSTVQAVRCSTRWGLFYQVWRDSSVIPINPD